jgi:Skp family chaperone for outer membrane proteins
VKNAPSMIIVFAILAWIVSLNMAHACTDWKAVAAFDALVLEHARNAVLDERLPDAAKAIENLCNNAQKLFEAASASADKSGNQKDRTLADQRLRQVLNCDPAAEAYQNALADLSLDRDHALADNCKP